MVHIYCDHEFERDTFTFTFVAGPSLKFSFDQPTVSIPTNRPFKRRRALSDVDGDGNEGRKKRRLRLHLITSRLSRPFSQPATNIVNRGVAKIAIWGARNRSPGKGALRKAAIMNRVRLALNAAKDFIRLEQEKKRRTLALREIVMHKPRCHESPLPRSPLGLSNYDALDLEDDGDDGDFEIDGMDRTSCIYSDFNIMNPVSGDGDDYGYLDALDGIQPENLAETPPPPPPDESIVDLLREKEKQGESYFVKFGE